MPPFNKLSSSLKTRRETVNEMVVDLVGGEEVNGPLRLVLIDHVDVHVRVRPMVYSHGSGGSTFRRGVFDLLRQLQTAVLACEPF